MTITYELDLSKSNIADFSELTLAVLKQLMKIGQESNKAVNAIAIPRFLMKYGSNA